MLEIFLPGAETLRLEHLVAVFNGTPACDGVLLRDFLPSSAFLPLNTRASGRNCYTWPISST